MIDQIGHGVRHKKRQYIDSFPAVGELDEYGYRHLYPQKGWPVLAAQSHALREILVLPISVEESLLVVGWLLYIG
jgi:hypothetical protein